MLSSKNVSWLVSCWLAVRLCLLPEFTCAVACCIQALIWSAVAASSAFPGLFHPQDLLARNALGEEVR